MTQINPPYDGSPACPLCNEEVRSISALMHNFLVRWPETQAFVKLNDIRQFWVRPQAIEVAHPAVVELFDAADAVLAACEGMTIDYPTGIIKWAPETHARICAIVPRAEAAVAALDSLSDEHWSDSRHSHGLENILRQSQGMTSIRFLPKREWNYTVDVVEEGGDLRHSVCGTRLALHQHFKDNLARDPAFYGSVWCPSCRQNLPFAQFKAD